MKKSFLLVAIFAICCHLSVLAEKAVGLDLSLLKAYENVGAPYMDADGNAISDVISWVGEEKGVNYIRLRLFVDPTSPYAVQLAGGADYISQLGGDLATVKELGKRVKDAGLQFLLDIQYSDGWADPGKQVMPYRWTSTCTTQAILRDSVYHYTKNVLSYLKANGAIPDMVQVGNEITYGMFYTSYDTPAGDYNTSLQYSKTNAGKAGIHCFATYWSNNTPHADSYWNNLCEVLKKGVQAVREECPSAKVMLHTERSAYTDYKATASGYESYFLAQMFYKKMEEHSVDYDVIGLSYYPEDHGKLTDLNTILSALESTFPTKEIMLAEYGYSNNYHSGEFSPNTIGYYRRDNSAESCPLAQKELVSALITTLLSHSKVTGMFYWFAEENEAWTNGPYKNGYRNRGLWANDDSYYASNLTSTAFQQYEGRALPAFDVLANFLDEGTPTTSYTLDFESGMPSSVSDAWCSGSKTVADNPTKSGINTSNKVMTVTNTWASGCELYTWQVELPSNLSLYDYMTIDIRPTTGTSYLTLQFDDGSWTKVYDNATMNSWTANAWNRLQINFSSLSDLTATHMYLGMWESGYSIDNIMFHAKDLTVTWDATTNGGSCATATSVVTPGNAIGTLPNATKVGYSFDGWYTQATGGKRITAATIPAADKTYYAHFTPIKYAITWKDGDGNTLNIEEVSYGETPVYSGVTPTKSATAQYTYTFNNTWSPSIVSVTGEAIYTAQFDANVRSYTITWLDDDDSLIDETEVNYDVLPTHADPSKASTDQYTYTFTGWTPTIVAVTGAATYKATYSSMLNQYTISFLNWDGSLLQADDWSYGSMPEYTGEEPIRVADDQYTYTFLAWSPDIVIVSGEATYTATFTATPKTPTGIEMVVVTDNSISGPQGMRVYDYMGKDVTMVTDNLSPGTYIIVVDGQARKVMISN